MNLFRRHWWLVATLGAMVVLGGTCVAMSILAQGKAARRTAVLEQSMRMLGPDVVYYNDNAVHQIKQATAYRTEQLENIQRYLQRQGDWEVLVPGIFPQYQAETRIYQFKARYMTELERFKEELGAVEAPEEDEGLPPVQHTMYTHEGSFYVAPWIGQSKLPAFDERMTRLRQSQDDLWLQEDIVRAIQGANKEYFELNDVAEGERSVAGAVVKELHEIQIGADVLGGRGRVWARPGGSRRDQRYLYVASEDRTARMRPGGTGEPTEQVPEADARARTLTGRASNNSEGRYKVLPFRVSVVADAGDYMAFVRRLSGTRSFITPLSVQYEIVYENENAYRELLRNVTQDTRVSIYGPRPLAKVTVTGESLIFQVEGARPTLPPKPDKESADAS